MAFYTNKLKQLRKERGLTQRQLADEIGLGKSAIGMYESGKRTPEFETLEAICDFFNVNMDVLSDVKSPPTKSEEGQLVAQAKTDSKASIDAAKATLAAAGIVVGATIPSTLLAVLATMSAVKLSKVESYAKYLAKEDDDPGDKTESSGE